MATKPLGYEGESRFADGSEVVLTALYGIVPTFEFKGRSEPNGQFVDTCPKRQKEWRLQ